MNPEMIDLKPELSDLELGLLAGLRQKQKSISPIFLYDQRGSELFERICETRDYYVTRTELGILRENLRDITTALGRQVVLVEYGSGSSRKTRLILENLDEPMAYVPVDISKEFLLRSARELKGQFPRLEIVPICADFTAEAPIPEPVFRDNGRDNRRGRRVVFFPGSTIGNFEAAEARALLRGTARFLGPEGRFLVGVDLVKEPAVLEAAYDDSDGVTAEFNLNLLRRLNREFGADFRPRNFFHRAVFERAKQRVEMHLVSRLEQVIQVAGERFRLRSGESIHTESSHKYSPESFRSLCESAGLRFVRAWTDSQRYFSVQLYSGGPTVI